MQSLIGLHIDELTELLVDLGEKPFRAKQLWHWIYTKGARDFATMQNIAKALQATLSEEFSIQRSDITKRLSSIDGTKKWLIAFEDGNEAETVFIPEEDRGTLCVSSQVGCTLTCKFCHTGTQKLVRNLTPEEIIQQVLIARDAVGQWPSGLAKPAITNIVFMGMGEPLFNYDNLIASLDILLDGNGLGFSKRKVTVSTSGVVPEIYRLGEAHGVKLAISLHATTDEVRNDIMPINKKYPIATLLKACREYPAASNSNRITFEYVMLKDINDSLDDAKRLVDLLADIPAKVNLIPFNPWPGSQYSCSNQDTIKAFADYINQAGYPSPVRKPRGQDILAACGQLRSESMPIKKCRKIAA